MHKANSLQGHKFLNYDLQLLQNHLKTSKHKQVVVAFQDSESFDSTLLTELIELFQYVIPSTCLTDV